MHHSRKTEKNRWSSQKSKARPHITAGLKSESSKFHGVTQQYGVRKQVEVIFTILTSSVGQQSQISKVKFDDII